MPTILLAEDDSCLRGVWRDALLHEGFRVLEASDGAEALRLAREWRGRLLITDILMPHLDGVRLAERLVTERPSLRVLYLSGRAESRLLARDIPGDQILLKPLRPEILVRRVKEVLERRARAMGASC